MIYFFILLIVWELLSEAKQRTFNNDVAVILRITFPEVNEHGVGFHAFFVNRNSSDVDENFTFQLFFRELIPDCRCFRAKIQPLDWPVIRIGFNQSLKRWRERLTSEFHQFHQLIKFSRDGICIGWCGDNLPERS